MADESLEKLYQQHRGNASDKWRLYLLEYDRILSPSRQEPVRLLEIGVQNGGSLELWAQFFPRAERIVGCDVDPDCGRLEFEDPRISVIVGDAAAAETAETILMESANFDIVIDDGSHRSGDIVKSFCIYFDRMAESGVYIVEDLHCSYWREFEGGLFAPYSAMAFFKALADVVNHRQWGVELSAAALLKGFHEAYGTVLDDASLERIHSIEFLDSMCVVRKSPPGDNRLGPRVVGGSLEPISAGRLQLPDQTSIEVPSQASNPWSSGNRRPEEQVPALKREIRRLHQRVAQLEAGLRGSETERRSGPTGVHQKQAAGNSELQELRQELVAHRMLLDFVRDSRSWQWTEFLRRFAYRNWFDRSFYLERYPDVEQSGMDPVEHYVAYGRWEGREPKAPTRLSYYGKVIAGIRSVTAAEGGLLPSLALWFSLLRSGGISGLRDRIGKAMAQDQLVGYSDWVRAFDTLSQSDRRRIRSRVDEFRHRPLISVIMPTYNTKLEWLKEAVESVRNQLYPDWELCIADDASTDASLRDYLEQLAREDERVKVILREENGHISRASNSALEQCSGEWVALLDHDDLLAEHALFCVAEAIDTDPGLQLIYSDEDKFIQSGVRFGPYFKTRWNPDLFYSHNMISHLGVYRRDVLDRIGGFRAGFEGSQDYDLALRFIEQIDADRIHHIPRVLYHWRMHSTSTASSTDAKPYAIAAGEKALQEHFDRKGVAATVSSLPYGYRVHYELPDPPPLVSLIVPTRNELPLLKTCVESILSRTSYPSYEILVVDNGSDDPGLLAYLGELEKAANFRVLRDERPFNFSGLNNRAVHEARGELLGFINNDIEVISGEWLTELVSMAVQRDVGAVGGKLLYPNDTIQHAGVVLGVGGVAAHAFKGKPADASGFLNRAILISSYSAVTAACMVVRKDCFLDAGGFDETHLPVAFGDVDLCLRLRELGYRSIFNPYALLYHHESASRGEDDTPEKQARFEAEVEFMKGRWGRLLTDDPAYSPNLTLLKEDFSLAWPPRLGPLGGPPTG